MSPGIEECSMNEIAALCERYDGQVHAAPPTLRSFVASKLSSGIRVFTQIFGGWQDQVGRPSRVMRTALIDPQDWEILGANPFLLLGLLPPIKKCVSRKRNEVQEIPNLDLQGRSAGDWENSWWQETRTAWRIASKMPIADRRLLAHLQNAPPQGREIEVDADRSDFCRALFYVSPRERRTDMECESFSLNADPPRGFCFRYRPYCRIRSSGIASEEAEPGLAWKLEAMVRSIPDPLNYRILARWWRRTSWFFGLF